MNYIAVDDEPFALEDLEETLREVEPDCSLCCFTSPRKALSYAGTAPIDVAFLDIEMGSMNGLVLAKQMKDLQPDLHIIFVTGFEQYALGAIRLHATGYLIKPAAAVDIRRELTFLYGNVLAKKVNTIRVQTFGGFAVFVNEEPVTFLRAKSKELLAYLVDRRGCAVTTPGACTVLWEDGLYDRRQSKYFQTVLYYLRLSLREAGIEDILLRSRNSLAIDTSKILCDSYQFLEGIPSAVNLYRHDYLPDYSWAEFTVGELENGI